MNPVGVLLGLGVFIGYAVAVGIVVLVGICVGELVVVGIAVLVGVCVGELVVVGIAVLVGVCGSPILFSFSGPSSKGNVDELSIQDININEISSRGFRLLV